MVIGSIHLSDSLVELILALLNFLLQLLNGILLNLHLTLEPPDSVVHFVRSLDAVADLLILKLKLQARVLFLHPELLVVLRKQLLELNLILL